MGAEADGYGTDIVYVEKIEPISDRGRAAVR